MLETQRQFLRHTIAACYGSALGSFPLSARMHPPPPPPPFHTHEHNQEAQPGTSPPLQASGWVAATRLMCSWTPEETRGAALGSLAFSARVRA